MSTKLLFAITVLLLGAVLVIAVVVERGGSAPSDRPVATADPAVLVRPGLPSLGPSDAKVTIVEFLDPACETCALFYPEVKRMLAANPGRLRLVTRHVPFTGLGGGGGDAPRRRSCKANTGRRWRRCCARRTAG